MTTKKVNIGPIGQVSEAFANSRVARTTAKALLEAAGRDEKIMAAVEKAHAKEGTPSPSVMGAVTHAGLVAGLETAVEQQLRLVRARALKID